MHDIIPMTAFVQLKKERDSHFFFFALLVVINKFEITFSINLYVLFSGRVKDNSFSSFWFLKQINKNLARLKATVLEEIIES